MLHSLQHEKETGLTPYLARDYPTEIRAPRSEVSPRTFLSRVVFVICEPLSHGYRLMSLLNVDNLSAIPRRLTNPITRNTTPSAVCFMPHFLSKGSRYLVHARADNSAKKWLVLSSSVVPHLLPLTGRLRPSRVESYIYADRLPSTQVADKPRSLS